MAKLEPRATIDPPRAIRIKTSTGWADLAIAGTPGYPDTTGKLADVLTVTADGAAPQWKPPAPQGAQITYIGQYDPAHVYHDGDYVVDANGMTYQCVIEGTTGVAPTPWSSGVWVQLPTVVNGQWVKGVGGSAVWAPITPQDVANIPYGTSLPAAPFDGQEAILVDSVTAPKWQWRLRYNAGSTSAYKWECIGGFPAVVADLADVGVTYDGAWHTFPGVTFTYPRDGQYLLTGSCRLWSGSEQTFAIAFAGAYQPNNYVGPIKIGGAQAYQALTMYHEVVPGALGAGSVVGLSWIASTPGTGSVSMKSLKVFPYRVA